MSDKQSNDRHPLYLKCGPKAETFKVSIQMLIGLLIFRPQGLFKGRLL